MSSQQGSHLNVILLDFEFDPPYFKTLHAELTRRGHMPMLTNSAQEAADCLGVHEIEAIIADDSQAALALLQDIDRNAFDETERPFFCVITNGDLSPDMDEVIDIYLPPLPPNFVERHVRSSINYRRRISKLKKSEQEVNLLKNAIVRNVSHELKTPLLQVKAAVGLITEDSRDDTLSYMAVTATARLETVVKNITLLADSLNGNLGPFQVHESIDQARRNLRRSWEHKDDIDRLKILMEDRLPPVMADRQGISIVMQQLIDNALKFSKEAGSDVNVHAVAVNGGICIRVEDFGIGIAEDKLKQIFETFYQIDNSSTRRYGGTGVGLSIVRLILEKHDVEIHVESEPGEGSTFSFVLPRAEI